MTDPRLDELEQMARDPEIDPLRIYDAMIEIGSNVEGLRSLVRRFGASEHDVLTLYLGMAISKAAWGWGFADSRLRDLIVEFLRFVRSCTHAGTLIATVNALQALSAARRLPLEDPEIGSLLGRFFLHCLDQQRDFMVPDACLDLLSHLWAEDVLERLLPSSEAIALRERLAHLEVQKRPEFERDLALLRDFWAAE